MTSDAERNPGQASTGNQEIESLLLPSGLLNEDLVRALRGPQARVELPSDAQMAVRLIPEPALREIFQIESDGALASGTFTLCLGAAIGFVTNVVTSAGFKWTPLNGAVISAFIVGALLSGAQSLRIHRRATRRRQALLQGET